MPSCMFCAKIYDNDLYLNTHLLFEHGKLRPLCSTNVDTKRLQIADLMRHDFDLAKNKPDRYLDALYILYKQKELGIVNVRNLWEFTGKTYTKNGKEIKEKVIIPHEKLMKILDASYFKESNRARYYDERYSFNTVPLKEFV